MILPFPLASFLIVKIQENSISLISSMDPTTIGVLTLGTTSMNMLAMNATTSCMLFSPNLSSQDIMFLLNMNIVFEHLIWYRYPTKDAQYHFFRHYLKPHQPNEVCSYFQFNSSQLSTME